MPVKAHLFWGKSNWSVVSEEKNMIHLSNQIPITHAFYCAISVYKEDFLSDTISKDVNNVKETMNKELFGE